MKRRSAVALAAGAVALAAFSGTEAGLLSDLFEKDRCELPKRAPCGDCSFGYARTSWRPWGTCCEARPAQAVPMSVPGGVYSPLDGMPYSTIPVDPHDGSPAIIESTPYGPGPHSIEPSPRQDELPPILSQPASRTPYSPVDPSYDQPLPPQHAPLNAPLSPDVRSIEDPVPSPPGNVPPGLPPQAPGNAASSTLRQDLRDRQQNSNQYRGPVEDPIRGLLPGTGYAPQPGGHPPVTGGPQNFPTTPGTPSSAVNSRSTPTGADSPVRSSPASPAPAPAPSAPRQPQPQTQPQSGMPPQPGTRPQSGTDYSEYIPLPNAEPVPRSLPIPNPADRARARSDAQPSPEPAPQREVAPEESKIESFLPGTLPLPESGTRPAASPADAGVTSLPPASGLNPYADYRVLPSVSDFQPQLRSAQSDTNQRAPTGPVFEEDRVTRTSAQRVNRHVEELTPRSLSRHGATLSRESRSDERAGRFAPTVITPQSAVPDTEYTVPDWKPLSDPSKTYRSTAPQTGNQWRTMQTPTGNRATRVNSQRRDASRITAPPWKSRTTSSTRSDTSRSQRTANASQLPQRRSATQSQAGSLPSVETLLSGEPHIDSRPARVVQETLYDVIDVRTPSSGARDFSVAALDAQPGSQAGVRDADPTGDWSSIRAADGNDQSIARSTRLTQ